MTVKVELNSSLESVAERLADQRHDTFSHSNYEDTAYHNDSYNVHLLGAKAEVAFSEYYSLKVDTEERRSGDQHDFEAVRNSIRLTIDVKATTHTPANLLVRESKANCDYYVSAHISEPQSNSVTLVGGSPHSLLVTMGEYKQSAVDDHMNYKLLADALYDLPPPPAFQRLDQTTNPMGA